MQANDLLEAIRDQARCHPLRLSIIALSVQGKSLDPDDLRWDLPDGGSVAMIEYHLLVLNRVGLLPPMEAKARSTT